MTHTNLKVLFMHDFKREMQLQDFETVREKYKFLISRWHALMHKRSRILFIRHAPYGGMVTQEDCLRISTAMRTSYPKIDFEIVTVNNGASGTNWGVAGVHNRYISRIHRDPWYGNSDLWEKMFRDFGIIS